MASAGEPSAGAEPTGAEDAAAEDASAAPASPEDGSASSEDVATPSDPEADAKRRFLLLCALVLLAVGVGAWLSRRKNKGDLEVYYAVVKRVGRGQDLYHYREGRDPTKPTAYIYPPPFALVFYPLTKLAFPLLRALWGALGVLLAARCFFLGWRIAWAGRPPPWDRHLALACGLGALVSLRFVWSDIGHGQVNLLVAWLTLEGIAAAEGASAEGAEPRESLAGALLAGAVALKLTPAIVVALYLVRGRGRLVGWTAAWGAVLLCAPSVVWGVSTNLDYLWRFASEVTPWNARFHAAVGNNLALPSALLRLLCGSGDAGSAPVPFLLALPLEATRRLLTVVSAAFLLASLAAARRAPAWLALGIVLAATPLISPLAWKPHLVVLLLPGLCLARLWVEARPGRRLALGGAVLAVLAGRLLLGKHGSEVALRWGIPSLGLLLLWAGLVRAGWRRVSPDEPQGVSSQA